MTPRHLSPAQRTMLRNALSGAPLHQGLTKAALHAGGGTRAALVKRGLLNDATDQPTEEGRAVFQPLTVGNTTQPPTQEVSP